MQDLLNVLQSNIIGILLMLITLFSLFKNLRSGMLEDRLFFTLVVSVMAVCFLEIMGTIFNYQTFTSAKELNLFFNAVLFAMNPLPAFLWASYVNCKVFRSEERVRKIGKILSIPLVIVICMSSANLFTDIFFTITPDNVYVRGKWFPFATLLSVIYIVYAVIILSLERKRMGKGLYIPLLSFMVLPVFGLTLQFLFYGIYMLWVSVALSVVIIFNYVQNDYSITDWLTGLYNRKHLDNYLQQVCKRKHSNLLVGLMMDIDAFKEVNDTYGHLTGDVALQDTAVIIKQAVGNKAYVARYAGDEFVVILELDKEEQIPNVITHIHEAFAEFNATPKRDYQLNLSIGHAIFKGKGVETEQEFLLRMDKGMYLMKKERKKCTCKKTCQRN